MVKGTKIKSIDTLQTEAIAAIQAFGSVASSNELRRLGQWTAALAASREAILDERVAREWLVIEEVEGESQSPIASQSWATKWAPGNRLITTMQALTEGKATKRKRKLSPEGRARIVAAAKARWAKVNAKKAKAKAKG